MALESPPYRLELRWLDTALVGVVANKIILKQIIPFQSFDGIVLCKHMSEAVRTGPSWPDVLQYNVGNMCRIVLLKRSTWL